MREIRRVPDEGSVEVVGDEVATGVPNVIAWSVRATFEVVLHLDETEPAVDVDRPARLPVWKITLQVNAFDPS
jgi:hypothetical protein